MLKKIRRINFKLLKVSFLVVAVAFFSVLTIQPAQAAGASFFLSPSSKTGVIGSTFSVAVKLNTGGQIINTVDGSISFDKNLLDVTGISTGGSLVNLWIAQPSFNNGAGSISFSGGVTPPGYNGTAGHVFTITFKSKSPGSAAVRFSSGAVLANDGKGTNILASMGSGSYTISPKVDAPKKDTIVKTDTPKKTDTKKQEEEKEVEIELNYNKPNVKSSTHPDSNAWYKEKKVKATWSLPEDVVGVSVTFDQKPMSDPGPQSDGLFDSKEYTSDKGGLWYLHVKFKDGRKWGTINHYRVMIDDIAPLLYDVKISEAEAGEWPELSFKAKDELSELVGYEIIVSSLEEKAHKLKADVTSLKLEGLEVGKHTAMIIAFDAAGNQTIEKIEFEIKSISSPKITRYSGDIKPEDKFFVSGTTEKDYLVEIFVADINNNVLAQEVVQPDIAGNWFYIFDQNLKRGRYTVWAEAINKNELRSSSSERASFIVSPPIFMEVGEFIIDYFTALVSLLFMIIIIIISIMYIVYFLRRRLKKETIEIETTLRTNLDAYQNIIDREFAKLGKYEGMPEYKKKKGIIKAGLKKKIASMEAKILKEVQDVEDILK